MKTKLLTPTLIILTALSSIYAYKKHKENVQLQTELSKSIRAKNNIQKRITEVTENFEKVSTKNKKLSRRFISEINKIIKLKDSVNELDHNLKTDQQILSQKTNLAQSLADKNKALSKEITEAKSLKIASMTISKMKKKVNGKYTTTSRTSKIDALKLVVKIEENDLALSGQKLFHVQLINPEGQIISIYKDVQLNNKILTCSDEVIFNYQKENIEVISLLQVNRDNLKSGNYSINAFIGGKLISTSHINLE